MPSPDTKAAGLNSPIDALQPVVNWTRDIAQRVNMNTLQTPPNMLATQIPGVGTQLSQAPFQWQPAVQAMAIVVDNGTNNYTDNRYWFQLAILMQGDTQSVYSLANPIIDTSDSNATKQTFTNMWELAGHTHMMNAGEIVWLSRLSGFSNGTQTFYQWVACQPPRSNVGTITGHTGTGPTMWSPYQVAFANGWTANVYNGAEPVNGSPGPLGVTIATNGTLTGTTCVAKALGTGLAVQVAWDFGNSRLAFTAENSAG